jgi:hypothetical protein
VIIYKNPIVADPTDKTKRVGVTQEFSIAFNTATDPSMIQLKSGSPGYLDGYAVKLGTLNIDGEKLDTVHSYQTGQAITGSDIYGKC